MTSSTAIRPCTVADIFARPDLLAEYSQESAIAELGDGKAQLERYQLLEASGMFFLLGAFAGDELVGFLTMLVSVLPHFGKAVATTESYFVAADARKGGTGMRLLHAAEKLAKEQGAEALLVCAPVNSRLGQVMPRAGYRETNRVFFRALT